MKKTFLLYFALLTFQINAQPPDHNCRMWGMITSGIFDETTTRNSLDALQQLGAFNPTGWGIGFYTQTTKGFEIPVIYRGMWRADQDSQFDTAAEVLVKNISHSGLAHVRNASSGYVNVPGPHPFYTKALNRNFEMMFAHNGSLSVPKLKELVGTYTDNNHYGYAQNEDVGEPNFDSDLYRLYLMKWIDEHPDVTVTKCLMDAMNYLTDQLGNNFSYNFILISTGDTLWALRYNNSLSYRYNFGLEGNSWEVASEPLGGTGWSEAKNHCLYIFTPNQIKPIVHSLSFYGIDHDSLEAEYQKAGFEAFYNPADKTLQIKFETENRQQISFSLFTINGQFVDKIYHEKVGKGLHRLSYNMSNLAGGVYIVKKETDKKMDGTKKFLKE